MKTNLQEGKGIGNLKVGALFALGSQLEALFYFQGHELASHLSIDQQNSVDKIIEKLAELTDEYHLGEFILEEKGEGHITFSLKECESCKDFPVEFKSDGPFCSFEAGLIAGIVEKLSGQHCFAQELACRLQGTTENCQFMIVLPKIN